MRFSQKIIALLLAALLMATALVPAFADGGATATLDWGVAYIERRGLGFSVDGEMKLRGKDILETKVSSQLTARFGEMSVVMSENSSMCVLNAENVAIEVQDGEAFVNVPAGQQAEFTFSGKNVCGGELRVYARRAHRLGNGKSLKGRNQHRRTKRKGGRNAFLFGRQRERVQP